MPTKGNATSSCKFAKLRTGVFVKSDQLDKSVLCCKTKFVEATSHESARLPFVGLALMEGTGVVCNIQMPPPNGLGFTTADSLPPSAEEATEVPSGLQPPTGRLLEIQVTPKSVEV